MLAPITTQALCEVKQKHVTAQASLLSLKHKFSSLLSHNSFRTSSENLVAHQDNIPCL